jgi:O-6-methylguanine DNA methyltransferase
MPLTAPNTTSDSLAVFAHAFARTAVATRAVSSVVYVAPVDTPLGLMVAGSSGDHLVLLEFAEPDRLADQIPRLARWLGCSFTVSDTPVLAALRRQLDEYFPGTRYDFDLPLEARGTPFQQQVWMALREIPCGATRSYADVARAIGRPTAVRAVAAANGDNRISILIPCHRVVGSDGKLVGYGGGLWRKERLLALETRSALSEPDGVRVLHDHRSAE